MYHPAELDGAGNQWLVLHVGLTFSAFLFSGGGGGFLIAKKWHIQCVLDSMILVLDLDTLDN